MVFEVCVSFCQRGGFLRVGGAPSWSGGHPCSVSVSEPGLPSEVDQVASLAWSCFRSSLPLEEERGKMQEGKKGACEKGEGIKCQVAVTKVMGMSGSSLDGCVIFPLVPTPTCISHCSRHTVRPVSGTHSLVQSSAMRHLVKTYYVQDSLHSSPSPA